MNIFSAKQLYEADKITTDKQGISAVDLMERAATQIYDWLHQRMQGACAYFLRNWQQRGRRIGSGAAIDRKWIYSDHLHRQFYR